MSEQASKVATSIDFDADGKQHGSFNVPHSRNDSAWGSLRVPITVIKNGTGSTLLFTAGNHGDEYEGQIALMKLARGLESAEIQGRVICRHHPGLIQRGDALAVIATDYHPG